MLIEDTSPTWTAAIKRPVVASPILVGDALFVAAQEAGRGAEHSDLIALDAHSGAIRWQQHFEDALISGLQPYYLQESQQPIAVIAVRGSDLLRGRGRVLALDLSGEIIWDWQSEEKSYSAPVAREMQVLVLAGDRTLAVISPEAEGDSVTRISLPANTSLAAPAVQDNMVYIPCRGPELAAVNLDGSVHWHFRAPGSPYAWLDHTPLLHETSLYTVSREGTIYALNAISGQLLWQEAVGDGRALSRPAAANGLLFVGTYKGLKALDAQNGRVRWSHATSRPISAAPLVAGNTVYAGGQDHRLVALDAETGDARWHYDFPRRIEQAPLLMGDQLVVADRGGHVVALPRPEAGEEVAGDPAALAMSLESKRARAEAWEAEGHFSQAAELWLESGELENAAKAYERAGSWLEAAGIWQQLDRYGKRADALEERARQLAEQEAADEEVAAAWLRAARAHAELGQREARRHSEREAARYRRQPFLIIEVEPGTMYFNAWSKVDFVIRNEGFGAARGLLVEVVDDRFEGHAVHTQTRVTIPPKQSYRHWLDVLPKAQGSEVPMQLSIEYMDTSGTEHRLQRTFYLPVAGEEQQITPVHTPTDREAFAGLEAPDGRDLAALRRSVVDAFSMEELRDILFDLGLRADDFGGRVSTIARELITYGVQANRFDELIELFRKRRPDADW